MSRAFWLLLLGLALTTIAGTFDLAPLYVPGVGFGALALLTPLWVELAARRVRVTRELPAVRVVEQEPVELRLRVSAGALPLPLPAVTIEDPLLELPLRLPAGGRSRAFTVVARFPRRGRHRIAPPALVLRDPFELVRRAVRERGEDDELLVLPRTSAIAFARRREGDGRAAGAATLLGAAATDVDGIRRYREGTPAGRIHWPALAARQELMERRLRVTENVRPLVVLDVRGAPNRDALDAAVRAAASLTLALAREGGCGLLLPGERRPSTIGAELGAWPAAHVRLALVEAGESTPGPALGGVGLRRGPLLYVSARRLDRLPPAAQAIARGPASLVVPGRLQGRESLFAVAGCHGYAQASGRRPGSAADARVKANGPSAGGAR
ncbi:DUF58 domain-containing protein [Conexibacter sp. JD483]|uniref:DUF58 domain-containing protein n=1 Tax=unclassified Conexibacter TaxID=2627773 RepID=UPI00271BE402|nr:MULTISPECIES: DUF58 domain-containing protein [unclassified Conexibacter]MDO8185178.1 DUF58 domain-containing protein [Conexibacter sp. CPCC 205706]MDO8196888.1 DUF58 domain-containing protein [Conexibacter sp. CPCC 205762]MDR9368664.1 DUF58 domain-containing protein [Conexibacter sp. JD483]